MYSPTKDILFAEAQALQSQLAWTQQAAYQQIHNTKEAAAHKLVNALSGYRDEFRDACEHYEEKLNTHQAQEVSTYAAISKTAQAQSAATQLNANMGMQRAEVEVNIVRDREINAQREL